MFKFKNKFNFFQKKALDKKLNKIQFNFLNHKKINYCLMLVKQLKVLVIYNLKILYNIFITFIQVFDTQDFSMSKEYKKIINYFKKLILFKFLKFFRLEDYRSKNTFLLYHDKKTGKLFIKTLIISLWRPRTLYVRLLYLLGYQGKIRRLLRLNPTQLHELLTRNPKRYYFVFFRVTKEKPFTEFLYKLYYRFDFEDLFRYGYTFRTRKWLLRSYRDWPRKILHHIYPWSNVLQPIFTTAIRERFYIFNFFKVNNPVMYINYFCNLFLHLFLLYIVILFLFFFDPFLIILNSNFKQIIYFIIPYSYDILILLQYNICIILLPFIFLLYSFISLIIYLVSCFFFTFIPSIFFYQPKSLHDFIKFLRNKSYSSIYHYELSIPVSFIIIILLFIILLNSNNIYSNRILCCSIINFNIKFIFSNYFLIDYFDNLAQSNLSLTFITLLFLFNYVFFVYIDLFRVYKSLEFSLLANLLFLFLFIIIVAIFFCNNYLILVFLIDCFMLILLFLSFLKYSDKITKQVYFLHFNNNFSRNRIVFNYFFKSKIVLALNTFKQYFLNFNKIHKKMNVFPFLKFKISATHPKYRLYLEQAGIARKHLKRRFYRRAGRFFLVYAGLSFLYYYICTHYLIFSNYTYHSFYYSFFLEYFQNLFFYSFSNNVAVFLLIIILFAKLGFGIFEFRFFTIIPLFDNSLNNLYFSFKISAVSLLIKFIDHFKTTIFNQVNLQYNLLEYCKINEQLKNFHELIKLASLKINFDGFKIINNTELVFSYFDCYLIKHYFIHYLSFIFLFISVFKVINFFYLADRFFNFSLTFRVTLKNDIRWALFKGNILHYFILSISLFNPVFSNSSIMFFTSFYCFMVTILVILLDIFTDQSIPIYLILRRYKYYFNALPCEYYLKYPFLSLFFIFTLSILGLNFPYLGLFSKISLISDNYFICNFLILVMYLFALKRYSSKIILHDFLLQFFNTLFPAYKRIKDLYFYVVEYYFCMLIPKNKLNYINLNFLVFILKNLYILVVLLLFLL